MSKKRKKKKNARFDTGQDSECRYIAYTDGGCAYNPSGPGGYGVVIHDTQTDQTEELSAGYVSTTNNRMELMAMVAALESLPDGAAVMLHSDSQYALGLLTGAYSPSKNHDLAARLKRAASGKQICTRWIPGHSGILLNERCDTLATEAMRSPTLKDTGFVASKAVERQRREQGGTMGVLISLPEGLERFYAPTSERKVKPGCAATIRALNASKKHSFQDFLALKTGGVDGWSRVDTEQEFPDAVREFAASFFSDPKRVASCLKWYGRGLALDLAIRKELVSEEVAVNAARSKWA